MYKVLAIHSTAAIAAMFLAGSVHAQTGSTLVQSALKCTTHAGSGAFNAISWSVGASQTIQNPASGQQQGPAGAAKLGAFNLIKAFDECSPALFEALALGSHLQTVTITDRGPTAATGAEAHTPVSPVTIQLQDVQVSLFVLNDAGSTAGPGESVSLVYQKITITNLNSGSKFCFDMSRNGPC